MTQTADPGQDPRGTPVDLRPALEHAGSHAEGREPDWYPSLDYDG